MAQYTRITRRHFMAGTVAAGAALALPWYLETGTAFAFYQSQGLKKFIQSLRGVGPGGITGRGTRCLLCSCHWVSPTTLFTLRNSRISYTLTSARRRCGATTRSYHWAVERNPRSTSAAFSSCTGDADPGHVHEHAATEAYPAGRHQLQLPRGEEAPECDHCPCPWWVYTLDQRWWTVHLVYS